MQNTTKHKTDFDPYGINKLITVGLFILFVNLNEFLNSKILEDIVAYIGFQNKGSNHHSIFHSFSIEILFLTVVDQIFYGTD